MLDEDGAEEVRKRCEEVQAVRGHEQGVRDLIPGQEQEVPRRKRRRERQHRRAREGRPGQRSAAQGEEDREHRDLARGRQPTAQRAVEHVGPAPRQERHPRRGRAQPQHGRLVREGPRGAPARTEQRRDEHHQPQHGLQRQQRVRCDEQRPLRLDLRPRLRIRTVRSAGVAPRPQDGGDRQAREEPDGLRHTDPKQLAAVADECPRSGAGSPLQLHMQNGYDNDRAHQSLHGASGELRHGSGHRPRWPCRCAE
mmetsp:Transcript_106240/g.295796  ORF Transcript_106240/g.295796 Transcript_106240/m.295796 type:complete len:253 (+) Transcript_106240:601-1359(+)